MIGSKVRESVGEKMIKGGGGVEIDDPGGRFPHQTQELTGTWESNRRPGGL